MAKLSDINLDVGAKINLDILGEKGETKKSLGSVVEEVIDNNHILIGMPIYKGNYYNISSKEELRFRFLYNKEMYARSVSLAGTITKNNLVFIKLKYTTPLKEHQMRTSYRLKCLIPIDINVIGIEETPQKEDFDDSNLPAHLRKFRTASTKSETQRKGRIQGLSSDLSAGGMLIITDDIIDKRQEVILTFEFNEGEKEEIKGIVLRVIEFEKNAEEKQYKIAIQFHHENEKQKERLYKFIIDKQMEQRRKSKLS